MDQYFPHVISLPLDWRLCISKF